eukprot:GEZU01031182.1.p1 GENE.GEZU01031182.1~~GEZU01031182.1.p1  ORF type:complete len:172 (+),score=47.44 GEZU01031182.1:244-759(+)
MDITLIDRPFIDLARQMGGISGFPFEVLPTILELGRGLGAPQVLGEGRQVPGQTRSGGQWVPAMDISESIQYIKVRLDLPGVPRDKVSIDIDENNLLMIHGSRKKDYNKSEEDNKKYHRLERPYGVFYRAVQLPKGGIDTSKVTAEFKDGVLKIMIPKTSEKQSTKHIPIK